MEPDRKFVLSKRKIAQTRTPLSGSVLRGGRVSSKAGNSPGAAEAAPPAASANYGPRGLARPPPASPPAPPAGSPSAPGLSLTVDGRHAPPKKHWNDDSPVNNNKQWFPIVSHSGAGFRPSTVGYPQAAWAFENRLRPPRFGRLGRPARECEGAHGGRPWPRAPPGTRRPAGVGDSPPPERRPAESGEGGATPWHAETQGSDPQVGLCVCVCGWFVCVCVRASAFFLHSHYVKGV